MKLRTAWLVALALGLAACAPVPPRTPPVPYQNPVLDRDFPDPAVLQDAQGWFYAYATQSESDHRMLNIQVARSRDLVHWEHLGDALPAKPLWGAGKQRFWAPHVIHDAERDRYVMYYSGEPDADRGTCLAVATAAAPAGPFADIGHPLLCGAGIEHIDPMAFDDPASGRKLLYWGSGPIRVQELAADRLAFAPGSAPRELIQRDAARPYRRLVEGAWTVLRDGWYYLFFSGDRCCGPEAHYAVMVARSRDPFGPFEERGAPILEANSEWRAPGHNSIATDETGADWMLYHAIRAKRHAADGTPDVRRLLLIERLEYREGWPSVQR